MKAYIVSSASSSLKESSDFYSKLGYSQHSTKGDCTYFIDNQIIIELNKNAFIRPGIRLFKPSWKTEIESIKDSIEIYEIENGHAFKDNNGMWIYLQNGEPTIAPDDSLGKANTGSFMGISLECTNFDQSISLYQELGFKIGMGTKDSGFLTMNSDIGIGLSLMKPFSCPHKFLNPSLTFFNSKANSRLIKNVLDAGISPYEIPTAFGETDQIENIILRDEGGFGVFMFSD